MSAERSTYFQPVQSGLQTLSLWLLIAAAVTSVVLTGLAILGVAPWLQLTAGYGDVAYSNAGQIAQVGITGLLVGLCFFIPASGRVLRLERTHRAFQVGMSDVADAYTIAHKADREGVFTLSREFDSVRERILHLREHPDLAELEPEILELAAQMSHEARDLAEVYSDEKVKRAQTFLKQRQEELAEFGDQIKTAQYTCDELKRWLQDVDAEERVVNAQLDRLEEDLKEILPAIGYKFDGEEGAEGDDNVFPLSAKPAPKTKPLN